MTDDRRMIYESVKACYIPNLKSCKSWSTHWTHARRSPYFNTFPSSTYAESNNMLQLMFTICLKHSLKLVKHHTSHLSIVIFFWNFSPSKLHCAVELLLVHESVGKVHTHHHLVIELWNIQTQNS